MTVMVFMVFYNLLSAISCSNCWNPLTIAVHTHNGWITDTNFTSYKLSFLGPCFLSFLWNTSHQFLHLSVSTHQTMQMLSQFELTESSPSYSPGSWSLSLLITLKLSLSVSLLSARLSVWSSHLSLPSKEAGFFALETHEVKKLYLFDSSPNNINSDKNCKIWCR